MPPAALAAIAAEWLRRPGSALPGEALLDRKVGDFLALSDRLSRPLGDEQTRRRRAEAATALAAGRFADADKALAEAELHSIGGSSDLTALPDARRLLIGENRADRAGLSFLRMAPAAYREAASRYGEASALIGLFDIGRSRATAIAQARVLSRIGEDFDEREGYHEAVALLRRLLQGLDSLEDTVSFADAEEALSGALEALADLEDDERLRAEALAHCRAGMRDLSRDEAALLWHALRVRFGRIAVTLGEARDDETLLEEAVTALANALSVWDRGRDEARWLEAEHMISRARAALGRRRNDLALLERAFNGFNRVAKTVERSSLPLRWAELQDQMGGVLAEMGVRYSEPVVLEEAVAAFAAALAERRRETVPLLWAASSANQARAKLRLAERRSDPALAREALLQMAGAVEVMRSAGGTANARGLEAELARAGALVEALRRG